ncbi:MAG: class II SORL domain-containing protein [Desulfobacterales bacterium]|nr:class II SORL domain-containing protein [Desulfobacterales bacterium]
MSIAELFQTDDWKNEKHVPVIEAPQSAKVDEAFEVTLSVGKEIAHPNTTEHHIRWIQLFFKPDGDKFAYQIGNWEFSAHGESVKGANEGPATAEPKVSATLRLKTSGTLVASSYCNIHGLWENSTAIQIG